MKILFFSALLFLSATVLKAQIIDHDNTKVLDAIQGTGIFSLNAGQDVYSYEPDDGWYKIRKEVYVNPGQVIDDKYLSEGTELKNEDGEVIGEVLKEIKLVEGRKEESFRGKDSYRAILEGYLFKTKFRDNSIPEKRLTAILEIKNRSEQQAAFEQLFSMYNFEERDFEELTARVYREENKSLGEEKDFRIIILFRGETTPYAILTKDHSNVRPEKIKMESTDGPFRIIYFYKPPSRQVELIEDQILYTYLAL